MTVLMFITYHHNFCSHHGHHLCRGKIGDMMAFPLSQLRAQSSPTSPSSVCTPGCTTMVEMSHTRNELVFVVRSMDRWFGRSDWRIGRWVKAFMTCNQLQRIWHFVSMTRLFKKKKKKSYKTSWVWISNWCTKPITTIFQCVRTRDPFTEVHVLHHSEYL